MSFFRKLGVNKAKMLPQGHGEALRTKRKRLPTRSSWHLGSETLESRTLLAVMEAGYEELSQEWVVTPQVDTEVLNAVQSDEGEGGNGGGCPVCGTAYCVTHLDAYGNSYAELSAIPDDALMALEAEESVPAQAPLADTFFLHSRPSATKKIYLDFDGHTTSGTAWKGGDTIVTPAYNVEGDSSFSNTELQNIQNIWSRVVENFAPFDVDVTTEEPSVDDLRKSGSGDQRWGIRVVIGKNTWGSGGAGVAYLGSFSWSSDTPCFVFPELLGNSNKNIAMATSHEVGHSLGLSHDGGGGDGSYYRGHGSGDTSWAAIMGAGYGKSIQHWSKGEYRDANNQEDDLAIIVGTATTRWTPNGNGFGYRPDDFGSSIEAAHEPVFSEGFVASASVAGVVERFNDVDVFKFFTSETLQATIRPAAVGPSLDILAKILDPSGQVLYQSNPFDSLAASFTQTLASGYYYLTIEGTGKGDVLGSGYSDYGSLGQYSFELTVSGVDGPEVQVLNGADSIADNTGTVSFGATPLGVSVTKTFAVTNVGTTDLVVQPAVATGDFVVTSNLAADAVIPAGGSLSFDVQFNASSVGSYVGTVSFATTDSNENPFDFTVSGTVDPPPAPEVEVRSGDSVVLDGTGVVDFGRIPVGGVVRKVFTVENIGLLDMTVQPVSVPDGFTVKNNFAINQVIAAGGNASFVLEFNSDEVGAVGGLVSFENSDADENPFEFTVAGEGYVPPSVQIIDDGDAGFLTKGFWGLGSKAGFEGDHRYNIAGERVDEAQWTAFVSPGRYRVSATWKEGVNRATNAAFAMFDGLRALDVTRMNQELAPDDFSDAGANWEDIGAVVEVFGHELRVRLTDQADQYVIADAIRFERLGDLPAPAPEIEVFSGGRKLFDGVSEIDFGRVTPGTPVSKEFVVRNSGRADLTVEPVVVPVGYSVLENLNAGTVLQPGQEATFVIQADGVSAGLYTGILSFTNSDADEGVFDLSLRCRVALPAEVQILDDGSEGFSATDGWKGGTRSGFEGDHHFIPSGRGNHEATWTFEVVPGLYQVAATWRPGLALATDAPYTVLQESVAIGGMASAAIHRLNQEEFPDDFVDAGVPWEVIGNAYAVAGTTLTVVLTDDANQYVFADAIRIQRLGDVPVPGPEISVMHEGEEVFDETGSVDFGSTSSGRPISKTFRVRNSGTADLTVQPITVPSGFTVTANLAADTVIAPGQYETFVVQFDAVADGSYSGELAFTSTDVDESPYNFSVSGTVAPPPAVQVLDDSDDGFVVSGRWGVGLRSGYDGGHRWSAAGNGADEATWTFAVTPGLYRVSATWKAGLNRASNAPFTISDDGSPISTVLVNQEHAPRDLFANDRGWADLGSGHVITGTELTVTLTDAANEYVIADAIRIERVGDVPTPRPEVVVIHQGEEVSDETGSVDFGRTSSGRPVSKTFRVKNVGTADLTVQPISVPAGFTVTTNFAADTVIAPGQYETFVVQFHAVADGSYSGELAFTGTDADESPYNFSVSGTVAAPPAVQVLDDSDDGFVVSGRWGVGLRSGYDGGHRWSAAGNGADEATWTFAVTPGLYRVSATWKAGLNRASNAPFTISDDGSPISTVLVNQEQAPRDLFANDRGWADLGSGHVITGTELTVTLTDAANEYVIADAIRIERLGDVPLGEPELAVIHAGQVVSDGLGNVDFGSTVPGGVVSKEFTVRNVGRENLTVQPVSVPDGFSVAGNFSADTVIAPGQSVTFAVTLDAGGVGSFAGEVSFLSSDADESPFNFTVSGTVAVPPDVQILDDGSVGFSAVGAWAESTRAGFYRDHHYSGSGSGNDKAAWEFTVTPGTYRVSASWKAGFNRATNAPFTVYDGAKPFETILVNQKLTPNDLLEAEVAWKDIGGLYAVTGTSLVVTLTDAADNYVIADAIRIERI
jgi:hypothetical protein